MVSNEIGTNIIFKKQLGLNYEIDQKYVGLKMKENNILSFNFRVPGALKDEVESYFKRFKLGEPILVDIGSILVEPVISDATLRVFHLF